MQCDPPGRTPVRASILAGAAGALALSALASPAPAAAQHEEPPGAAAHALEDVTVVEPDGSRRSGVTVVVRDGLVEALGPDVEVPGDAERLEGDSLLVYPGLVDADGGTELTWPGEDGGDDETTVPWNPGRTAQGFTPSRHAVDAVTATGDGLEQLRRQGVVASAVHPDGGLAPGQGVLLSHRPAADVPRDLVVDPRLGLSLTFETADQAYPSTHYGVLAFLRQRLADAERHQRVTAAHAESAAGMRPPSWDPDLKALSGGVSGPDPVFFRADRAEDVRQVLDLGEAHGFRPVIVGGRESWEVADRLARRDVPVLLSLDFPEPQRWEPPEDDGEEADDPSPEGEAGEAEGPPGEGGDEAAPDGEQEEELEPEVLREKRRIEDAWAAAGRLADAGVRVALTSGGGEADLREGARKAVEYGLSEDEALAALTATPARLLGAPWLAGVREGRPANLVVTDGPLFAEDTRIRYTFVEGALERGAEPGEAPDEPPAVDVSGRWEAELETGSGSFAGTLSLEQQDARFDGTMSTQFGESRVVDGTVSGSDVTFTVVVDAGGQTLRLSFTGTASEREMSGSGSGPPPVGSFTWEAERSGGPDGGEGR